MKKLILLLLISSCNLDKPNIPKPLIVKSISTYSENNCIYTIENSFYYIASCGKFQIGDTLSIVK